MRRKSTIKILYPFCGVAGIFFPVGLPKDGGTCEFASPICLKECAAFKYATDKIKIPYKKKVEIYRYIVRKPLYEVCYQIMKELDEMNTNLLYWFASGDCIRKYTQKIIAITKMIEVYGIIQCGFTRNKVLWREAPCFVLTVEDKKEIEKISESGLFAVPNYKSGSIELYLGDRTYGGACSSSFFTFEGIEYEANCLKCYKNKRGCFNESN